MASSSRKSPLAPLAPVFYLLNWIAFFGWSYVLYILLTHRFASGDEPPQSTSQLLEMVRTPVIALECICAIEVLRIILGDLPGSLALGVILHVIRFTAILEVLPRGAAAEDESDDKKVSIVLAVLFSWAITEVTRYPMYLFPSSEMCRSVRMVVPLATFPLGAWAEGYGAFQVFTSGESLSIVLQLLLLAMMLVNGILGPSLAYPHIFWKAAPILGLVKKKEKKTGDKPAEGQAKTKAKIKAV